MKSLKGRQYILLVDSTYGVLEDQPNSRKEVHSNSRRSPASSFLLEKPFVLYMKHKVSRTLHISLGVIKKGVDDGVFYSFWRKDRFFNGGSSESRCFMLLLLKKYETDLEILEFIRMGNQLDVHL